MVESRYAAKDRAAAAAAAAAVNVDPNDRGAVLRAQAEGEMRMFAGDLVGDDGGPGAELDAMQPKTKAEFEKYADVLVAAYGTRHKDSKQYKLFVKQVARGLCESLEPEEVKDVETALAGVRSAKLKAAREAKAQEKKGVLPHIEPPPSLTPLPHGCPPPHLHLF